ncbi:MAG: hypothetical protein ACI9CQ_004600, partial [Saprospiraceae bacterium]
MNNKNVQKNFVGFNASNRLPLKRFLYTLVWLISLLAVLPMQATTIYVNTDAVGAGNGDSWTNAYSDLQSALAAANSGDDIWVAAGIYYPTSTTDRIISFVMKKGVGIYGGFNGTETDLSQRNWTTNLTTLSGDIGTLGDNSDNSHHVIYNFNAPGDPAALDNTAILDGCMITSGNADDDTGMGPFGGGQGGGMFNLGNSPTISNCMFIDNNAQNGGGGMSNDVGSSPVVTNCNFIGNTANNRGGGINNDSQSSPNLTNCSFNNNMAGSGGGFYTSFGDPSLNNCSFSANTANGSGGGMTNGGGTSTMINCSFNDNTAQQGGGIAVTIDNGDPTTVTNSILWGNSSGIYVNPNVIDPIINVSYSIIQDGYPGTGNLDMDPLFTSPTNLQLQDGSPAIDAGTNTVVAPAVTTDLAGQPRIVNGTVDMGAYEKDQGDPCANLADFAGGGFVCDGDEMELDASPAQGFTPASYEWSNGET